MRASNENLTRVRRRLYAPHTRVQAFVCIEPSDGADNALVTWRVSDGRPGGLPIGAASRRCRPGPERPAGCNDRRWRVTGVARRAEMEETIAGIPIRRLARRCCPDRNYCRAREPDGPSSTGCAMPRFDSSSVLARCWRRRRSLGRSAATVRTPRFPVATLDRNVWCSKTTFHTSTAVVLKRRRRIGNRRGHRGHELGERRPPHVCCAGRPCTSRARSRSRSTTHYPDPEYGV